MFFFHSIQKDKMTEKRRRGLVIINDRQILLNLPGGLLKDREIEWVKLFTGAGARPACMLTSPPDPVIITRQLQQLST